MEEGSRLERDWDDIPRSWSFLLQATGNHQQMGVVLRGEFCLRSHPLENEREFGTVGQGFIRKVLLYPLPASPTLLDGELMTASQT